MKFVKWARNYFVKLSTYEPATKMEGFCLCFVRLSHEAVARRPNGLRYSPQILRSNRQSDLDQAQKTGDVGLKVLYDDA